MLQIVRFQEVIQETKTVVSFMTYEGHRVDISKKFIKKADDTGYYFTKKSSIPEDVCITDLRPGRVYIIEAKEAGMEADSKPILMVIDIIPFDEVEAYNKVSGSIKETSRGAW